MTLQKGGFLPEDLSEVRQEIRNRYPAHFDLLERVNAFANETRSRVKVYNRDPQQLVVACLMLKVFEDIHGAVLVLESGLVSQGRSLLRVATEALIILGKVANSEQFFRAYKPPLTNSHRMFKKAIQQGRSERKAEA